MTGRGKLELLDDEEHPVVDVAVPVPSKPLFLASYVDGRADLQHAAGQRPGDVGLSTGWLVGKCAFRRAGYRQRQSVRYGQGGAFACCRETSGVHAAFPVGNGRQSEAMEFGTWARPHTDKLCTICLSVAANLLGRKTRHSINAHYANPARRIEPLRI